MQRLFLYAAMLPLVVLLYWVVPARFRSAVLLLCSVAFIGSIEWYSAAYFLINVVLVHAAGRRLRGQGDDAARSRLFKLTLLWLVGSLCWFKYVNGALDAAALLGLDAAGALPRVIMPLGLSYIVFRMIHYTVESYRRRVPDSSLVDFAAYVLFFPTLLSGPVERFGAFHKQTEARAPFDFSYINYGLFRVISGIVKKVLVADRLLPLVLPVIKAPMLHPRAVVVASLYGLGIQVYLDFSGYTDIALGVAMLLGYRIMENFNLPYFKPNLAEMWRSWHISVYSFIRDYFFFPFFGRRATTFKLHLGTFLTFVVFMVWHEGSARFLALGAYHGAGMVIWSLFQLWKRKNASVKQLVDHKELAPLHTFIAASFFGFGFVFFFLQLDQVAALVLRLVG